MATYGPNTTGTGADLGASWTSPGNITVNDASYAVWSTSDGACFIAGTKISTPDGYKFIEDIIAGDVVYDANMNIVTVMKCHVHTVGRYISLSVDSGLNVCATEEHPFLSIDVYKPLSEIMVGDKVSDMIVTDKINITKEIDVYNLSVDGSNTFIANGFKVHNK